MWAISASGLVKIYENNSKNSQSIVIGIAVDANCSGGDMCSILHVADHGIEYLEGWDICVNVVTTIHGTLVVISCHWIQCDNLLQVDGEFEKLVHQCFLSASRCTTGRYM